MRDSFEPSPEQYPRAGLVRPRTARSLLSRQLRHCCRTALTVLQASRMSLDGQDGKCAFYSIEWIRKRWDSNPRYGFPHAGFQDRFLKPLGHSSIRSKAGLFGRLLETGLPCRCNPSLDGWLFSSFGRSVNVPAAAFASMAGGACAAAACAKEPGTPCVRLRTIYLSATEGRILGDCGRCAPSPPGGRRPACSSAKCR